LLEPPLVFLPALLEPPLELLLLEPLLAFLLPLLEPLDLLLLLSFVVGTFFNSPLKYLSFLRSLDRQNDYIICRLVLVFPGIHKALILLR